MTTLFTEASGCTGDALGDRHRAWRRGTVATFVFMVLWLGVLWPPASYAVRFTSLRPDDDVWLVSTRHIRSVRSNSVPDVRAQRYDPSQGWQPADVHTLFEPPSSDHVLVVYVHGNRVDSHVAAEEGRLVYRSIMANLAEGTRVRLVIWSWPSDRIRGALRDVRQKAQRTELESYCLGWFLGQVPQQQKLSLLCYSFGTRVATGAMHLVRGGQLAGRVLPRRDKEPPTARVVLMAAAVDNDWLRPGGRHEMAIFEVDHLLNLYNRCDRVLKHYSHLYRNSQAEALGYTGMRVRDLIPAVERVEQQDVCQVVQDSHAAIHYLEAPQLQRRIRDVLLWMPVHGRSDAVDESRGARVVRRDLAP